MNLGDLRVVGDLDRFGLRICGLEEEVEELLAVALGVEAERLDRFEQAVVEDAGPADEEVVRGAPCCYAWRAVFLVVFGLELELGRRANYGGIEDSFEPLVLVDLGLGRRGEHLGIIERCKCMLFPERNERWAAAGVSADHPCVAIDFGLGPGGEGSGLPRGYHKTTCIV